MDFVRLSRVPSLKSGPTSLLRLYIALTLTQTYMPIMQWGKTKVFIQLHYVSQFK